MQLAAKDWLNQLNSIGGPPPEKSQFDGIRISNLVAGLMASVVILQCSMQHYFQSNLDGITFAFYSCHALLFLCVYISNYLRFYAHAKIVFVLTLFSYGILSSIAVSPLFSEQHLVFLLGLMAVPAIFHEYKPPLVQAAMLCFIFLFVIFELRQLNLPLFGIRTQVELEALTRILFACTVFVLTFKVQKILHQSRAIIAKQRNHTQSLLNNMLPTSIAKRLSGHECPIADHFEQASIMFADLTGFTKLSQQMPPGCLVTLLNELFSAFDQVATKYGLEKIKTNGDQYMLVSGVPLAKTDHAYVCCLAARFILREFKLWQAKNHVSVSLRIGINTGEVIAGVIGTHKYSYDLWGESVNIAARMESHGLENKIQVSQSTFDLVQSDFNFELRENVSLKGMGLHNTYLMIEHEDT